MRSYDLYEGQIVEVTIKGVRVTDTLGSGFRGVNDDGIVRSTRTYAATNELYFPERAVIIGGSGRSTRSTMTVKVGDIYRAHGDIWYVREYQGKGGTVVIENGRGDSYSDDKMNIRDEMQDFENLKPTLLTRDGKAVQVTEGTEFPGELPEDITTDRDGDGTWHAYITDTTGTKHLVANITENGTEFDIVLFDRYIEVNADSVYQMLMTCTPPVTRNGTGWV